MRIDGYSITGTYIQITLKSELNEISFKLYEPELALYKKERLSESEYLLSIINEISVFAENKDIESFNEL